MYNAERSTEWTQLCDGIALHQAFSEIAQATQDEPEPEPEPEPEMLPLPNANSHSLQQFVTNLDGFVVTQLQVAANLSRIDVDSISNRGVSAESSLLVRRTFGSDD